VEVDPSSMNVAGFCREHGISTWWFYELRRRFAAGGYEAIEVQSRAPHRVANRTSAEVEDRICELRKALDDAGLDAGASTIQEHLRRRSGPGDVVPAESTIYRILVARGLITPNPKKRPKTPGRRFQAERANELWPLDDTTWALADGSPVKVLNVLDDYSRLLVASEAMPSATGARALNTIVASAEALGLPAEFLSDNARAFRDVLAEALAELGIAARHTRPFRPQTNGKVERFHQTLKKWLAKQTPPATIEELQFLLDCFRHYYNHERPHRALGRRTPAEAWTTTPKDGPSTNALTNPTRIYRGIINRGNLRLARRWRIRVGAEHNDQAAIAVVTGLSCHIFINGRCIEALELDPTRVDQPLYNRKRLPSHREG
jgi:transposase InsO family protein